MEGLLVAEYESEDSARSPEMRYLASCLRADARSVFGEIENLRWRPGLRDRELPRGARPVLVIGKENVHLGAASLRAMKARIDAGVGVVLPGRLAGFRLAEETPVYTLRAFEQLERRLLDEEHVSRERRSSHLPVALFSATAFETLAGRSLAELVSDANLLGKLGLAEAIVYAGVFHDYVDYYGEAREDILPFVPEGAREVLEIGCGRGVTGALLQERLGCRVTGVELNPEVAADAARRLHRVVVGNVEELDFGGDFEGGRFDAVVATELFEHLNYPEKFLGKMRQLLRPGGRIVLSVPNVGHYSVVEDLLAGRWDYLPIGLLCYTHFRFFTRATLEAWLYRTGFESFEIIAQTTELPERFREWPGELETDEESLRTKGFYVVVHV